jgi:spermidine synthase
MESSSIPRARNNPDRRVAALACASFLAGLCSIVYELLIATTISYFLGDGVLYFSLTIGFYLAAMGIGTFASRFAGTNYVALFGWCEVLLALFGGLSVPLLYAAYSFEGLFFAAYLFLTFSIGFLIGLEIPFLARLMEPMRLLKENLANVLSLDYLGALCATLALPLLLLPWIGVFQTSIAFGIVNLSICMLLTRYFGQEMGAQIGKIRIATAFCALVLAAAFLTSTHSLAMWEQSLYDDRIVHSEQSRYQRIVLTKDREDVRLYLDGNLQFSSVDEYRYHEALIAVPTALMRHKPESVLLLGAGDGLAAKLLLRSTTLKSLTIVDLDPAVTALASRNSHLLALNDKSLLDKRVRVLNQDAYGFLEHNEAKFDLVVADLPDPNSTPLAKLYSKQFYALARQRLSPGGAFVTQATSPYFAPTAYWTIVNSVGAAEFRFLVPYHAYVPSFGDWGFVVASDAALQKAAPELPAGLKFISRESFSNLFQFESDVRSDIADINTIDQPVILSHYLGGWQRYK